MSRAPCILRRLGRASCSLIVLAHRLSLLDSPGRATIAGLPMVALMIGYTILSLWIIAQPIVVEPGVQQAAFR